MLTWVTKMGTVRIEYAKANHAPFILQNLRDQAIPPVVEWIGNVEGRLRQEIEGSAWAYAGYYNDDLAVVWGVKASSMVSGYGYLWMISTQVCDEHPFLLARHSRKFVDEIKSVFPVLHGLVERKYRRSQNWLRWLGFSLVDTGDPIYYEFTNRSI